MINELVLKLKGLEQEEYELIKKKEQLLVVNQIFEQIEALDNEVSRLNNIKTSVREQMVKAFRDNYDGTNDVFETDGVRVKYTPPTTRKSVDTNILKATYPDVYRNVLKESVVKDKVTVTFKERKEG